MTLTWDSFYSNPRFLLQCNVARFVHRKDDGYMYYKIQMLISESSKGGVRRVVICITHMYSKQHIKSKFINQMYFLATWIFTSHPLTLCYPHICGLALSQNLTENSLSCHQILGFPIPTLYLILGCGGSGTSCPVCPIFKVVNFILKTSGHVGW